VPFCEAFAATGSRGVLGDENGMVFHRGLLAVIFGFCRAQPLGDED